MSRRYANSGSAVDFSRDDFSRDDTMPENAKKTMAGRLRELVERPTGYFCECTSSKPCTTFKRDLLSAVSAVKAMGAIVSRKPNRAHH